MIVVLQLSWFFDFAPWWLSPLIIILGLMMAGIPFAYRSVAEDDLFTNSISIFVIALGMLLIGIPAVLDNISVYAITAFLLAKLTEGRISARFYEKVIYTLSNRRLPPSRGSRIVYYFLLILLVIIAVSAIVTISGFGLVSPRSKIYVARPIVIIYTLYILCSSILGLVYRFWGRNLADEIEYASPKSSLFIIFGGILVFSGAEIYNFTLFSAIPPQYPSVAQIAGGFLLPNLAENIATGVLISILSTAMFSIGYISGLISIVNNPKYE